MDIQLEFGRGETAAHARLKRLALIWAQAERYSICAPEVQLPRCRYRADVAAYRHDRDCARTAVFECKQCPADLRRDNCDSNAELRQLESLARRREILERNLRIHFPSLRRGETLFPDCDGFDFASLNHRSYSKVTREYTALQQRLRISTKFETLVRYRCANLFYLVIPARLLGDMCAPTGWGILIERGETLELIQQPVWHDVLAQARDSFLRCVARAATRAVNREWKVTTGRPWGKRDTTSLKQTISCAEST